MPSTGNIPTFWKTLQTKHKIFSLFLWTVYKQVYYLTNNFVLPAGTLKGVKNLFSSQTPYFWASGCKVLLRIWLCNTIIIYPSTGKTISTIRLLEHNKAMNNARIHALLWSSHIVLRPPFGKPSSEGNLFKLLLPNTQPCQGSPGTEAVSSKQQKQTHVANCTLQLRAQCLRTSEDSAR